MPAPSLSPLYLAYLFVFTLTAAACFGSVLSARRLDDEEVRNGLVGLLVTSGSWSLAHLGFLVAPTVELKLVFYHVGLFVGLSTVGPWLYFCSAFTGRSLHRSVGLRRAAIGVFVALSLVKVTNPFHRAYFRPEVVTQPFPYVSISSQPLHWVAMGLAYALAMVGYFMLFELFLRVGHDTRPLFALVGVTGLPVVLDVFGEVSPLLLDITYEPLGVAAFALGVLFLFLDDFRTVQLAGDRDDPVVVLDDQHHVRDFNPRAAGLFPGIDVGSPIEEFLPGIGDYVDGADRDAVYGVDTADGARYYQLAVQSFSTDRSRLGTAITLTDVTEREEYRRELERQNERLEQFASMVSHDLRNPLTVARGRVDYLRAAADDEDEHLRAVARAHDRMETLIDDVLTLARQGQSIDERERVRLSAVTTDAWASVTAETASMTIEQDGSFLADETRLTQLLENLFRNAVEHGGDAVTVRVGVLDGGGGFYVADDGVGIPETDRERVLESGYSTAEAGTGLGLSIVTEIAQAHDWDIDVRTSADGGARFEIRGMTVETT
ncbi:ATP-binding protein [Haloarcula onubensis]|uniref:histidine kinase n=1 Tax=Haloarcula onubensis TaxID=2950539 RepID=A0ABU2FMI6_9EURY|nr:ATP-binding protein [Halomicroarcula sp. S3CR25-11]MDS0281614.1 ATP-binding protein [Halomicroarcula sp. S3CR25-11]